MQEVGKMIRSEEKEFMRMFEEETDVMEDEKDTVWNNIEAELFPQVKKSTLGKRIAVGIGAVAAACILIIIATGIFTTEQAGEPPLETDPNGQSGSEIEVSLADEYDEEIQIVREPEGQTEVFDMKLAVDEDERYIIYIGKDDYSYDIHSGQMKITFNLTDDDDRYPEVGISIHPREGQSKDELIETAKDEIEQEQMEVIREEEVTSPVDAYVITAYAKENPNEWNSPVHAYYIHEAAPGKYFVFKQMNFMEALDGHSNTFHSMLETFEYVPEE